MLKQFGSATALCMTVVMSTFMAVAPASAQVSLYHMDFSPDDFDPLSPGLVEGELNIGPTNFALPGFGWDETHGQQARPGVFFPDDPELEPEQPGNRSFLFLFGAVGQTNSTFTSTAHPGSTFPVGGIDPTNPEYDGLGITWSQHLEATNTSNFPVHVRVAVQTAGGDWYASSGVFDTGIVGQGSQGNYDLELLLYNPAKANWRDLTIGELAADGVTIGAEPAVDLSGNITGIGFIGSFDIQSTVHIDFVDIGIPPVPGDVDGDRMVTVSDYNTIKMNFGTDVAGRTDGDVNGDGTVDLLDFAQWKSNFPFPGGASVSLDSGAVPEPASAVLAALSALALVCGRRRIRRTGESC